MFRAGRPLGASGKVQKGSARAARPEGGTRGGHMKILRFLIGCALALACAHEGKTVGRESNTAQATASQGVNPQAASTADASKQDTAAAAATRPPALAAA